MFLRQLFSLFSMTTILLLLCSANQHHQTSANSDNNLLNLHLHHITLEVNLDSPKIQIEKFSNGQFKSLLFFKGNSVFKVYFYKNEYVTKEQISYIQEFKKFNQHFLLDGSTFSYSKQGKLLTQTEWKEGKLHGIDYTYNEAGQLIEEKRFYRNHPIDKWKLYYPNGVVAKTISFPSDYLIWNKTLTFNHQKVNARQLFNSKKKTLYNLPTQRTITATEIWFNNKGVKQLEKFYKLYKKSNRFYIKHSQNAVFFTAEGNPIQKKENKKNVVFWMKGSSFYWE